MVLKGKIAVITGTATGIGQATAILFAREGAQVVCIDEKPSDETLGLMQKEGLDATCHEADVSDSNEVQRVARACEKRFDKVDILFNNAGRVVRQPFETTTEELWAEMLDVNLTGQFLCSKYFVPLMKKAGSGSIINHASIDAFLGEPRHRRLFRLERRPDSAHARHGTRPRQVQHPGELHLLGRHSGPAKSGCRQTRRQRRQIAHRRDAVTARGHAGGSGLRGSFSRLALVVVREWREPCGRRRQNGHHARHLSRL